MDLNTTKTILKASFMVVIAALMIASFFNVPFLVFVMIGFLMLFVTVYAMFWRCPNCKKHLGKLVVRQCRNCGQPLYK